MYKIISPILFLFSGFVSSAQDVDTSMMSKIRDEALNHSMVAQYAHQLTDMAGPRLTNSPGYFRATEYIVKAFKEIKLDKSTTESWGYFGKGWSNEQATVLLKTPYFEDLIAYPVAWTKSTSGALKQVQVIMLDS